MTTFFHEISHGIAALLTGGSVDKIMLHLRGSGLCYTQGGVHFLVAFSGYFGAALWGSIIYLTARRLSHSYSSTIAFTIAALIAVTGLLWGRDMITLFILAVLCIIFVLIAKLDHSKMVAIFIQSIGLYIIRDAVSVPLYLIDGRHFGDGATLSDITFIPEIVWVIIWCLCGISALIFLWKSEKDTMTVK